MTDDAQPATSTPAIAAAEAAGSSIALSAPFRPAAPRSPPRCQGIPLAALLRTIVVRRGDDDYVFVLVPGAVGGSTGRSCGPSSA